MIGRERRVWLFLSLLSVLTCMNLSMLPHAGGEPPGVGTQVDGTQMDGAALLTSTAADAREGTEGDLRKQPFRYWRSWANRPLPVVPAFFFLFMTSTLAVALVPEMLTRAQASSTNSFWRSLLSGFLTAVIALVFARVLFISEIGNPLALVILALVELGLLMGLAALAWLIGESLLSRLRLSGVAMLSRDRLTGRLVQVALGVALISTLLLIPGLGNLPRVGIRLVLLVAALGLGGLVRSWRTRTE